VSHASIAAGSSPARNCGERETRRGRRFQDDEAIRAIDRHLEMAQQAEARRAEHPVGMNLAQRLGAKRRVGGEIELAEANGADVAVVAIERVSHLGIDARVVTRGRKQERSVAAAGADRQPDEVVEDGDRERVRGPCRVLGRPRR
jgi:hypothetical protein